MNMNKLKRIDDKDYITNLFRNLAKQKSIPITLTLKNKQFRANLSFTVRKGCEPSIIIEDDAIELKAGEKVKVSFSDSELGIFFKTVTINACIGNGFDIERPILVYASFRRLVPRYKFSENEEATICFEDDDARRRLTDMSVNGLSFLSTNRFLEAEATINNALISINRDFQLYINGKVRYIKQNNQCLYQYGIEFEKLDCSVSDKLFELMNQKVRPELKSFKSINRSDIEEVIEGSNPKHGFEPKKTIESVSSNLEEMKNNDSIFSGFSYHSNGKCLALGTSLRIYDRTFIGQQACCVQEAQFDPKPWTEIYSGLADHLLLDPYFENYMICIPKDNTWQVEAMTDIEKIISDKDKFSLDFHECYVCNTLRLRCDNIKSQYVCESLDHIDTFLEYCRCNLSPLTVRSYGYHCNSFFLDEIKLVYESLGYFMERRLFCVKKDGKIVAFTIAESSSDTFNFNGINDHCRLYLIKTGLDINQILRTLLPVVARFFDQYGKRSFRILVRPTEHSTDDCKVPGVEFENEFARIIMDHRGLVEYKKLLAPNFVDFNKYYQLTYPQMAIWQTEKFFPGTSFGNIVGNVLVKDDIDLELLEKAINLVVKKNDGFRIRVVEEGELVKQYIAKYHYFKVDFIDFSKAGGYEAYMKWNESKTGKPFTLIDSELFYFAMLKINENECGLYTNSHHLIADAWTAVTQTSKIVEYYYKLKKGISVSEENEPSYIDFIMSEKDYLNSKKYESHERFWSDKFSTVPEFINFKPIGAVYRNIKAARKTIILSKELTSRIHSFCERFKSSPMIVFLSVLYIYINRVTSKSDIVIGTPVLNRANAREKNMVGMFISVVPIRFRVDGTNDFLTFVNLLSKEFNVLLRNQRYPYDLIQTEFREKHKVNENLFDIMLSYQTAKMEKTELTGDYTALWKFNGYQTDSLQIHISDRGDRGEYALDFDYLVDTFSEIDMERMSEQIINILEDSLHNPYKEINDLTMISDGEKIKLLHEFNDTDQDYPQNKTIHELFEEQVKKTPENTAVTFAGEALTYAELNHRANSLAYALRNKGIKPDEIVGIMLERSTEMIIGILGVLKAGGAYLPLDNSYPEERLNYMIQDSGCQFILVQKSFNNTITFDGEFIFIDDENLYVKQISNIENVCTSRNLAYVIYTSGSTGEPKGVMLEHRGVANLKIFFKENMGVSPSDRIIQFASCSFDAFVWEVFMALLTGASLYMISKNIIENYIKFEQFLNENEISVATLPPSYLANLDPEKVVTLQKLISAGSSITYSLMKKWCHKALYMNAYGPTETTICATVWKCSHPDVDIDFVPIGTPICNTKILIVNKYGQLQPIGVAGELCISGVTLARGYMNKVELTAEKFIPCPFFEGARLYRTGDLARWLSDGNIEFLGRIDNQVKIRGFRVELGEIENLLLNHPAIKDAFVLDKQDDGGNSYLCAYVVLEDKTFPVEDLKNYLAKKLPGFMVPAYIIQMDSLPISPNGKIDKKALPEPVKKIVVTSIDDYPVNEVEKELLEFWKDALELENVGVNDNIFELGADSFAIMRVLTRTFIFDWDISMQDFYEHQTIRKLSDKILGNYSINAEEEGAAISSAAAFDARKEISVVTGRRDMKNILLTGATGFLGIHLLCSILEGTKANVYCLVREKNTAFAKRKLMNKLEFYFDNKYNSLLDKRIFVLHGDVTFERMGLCQQEYESLARKVDTTIHAAAIVKHFGDYATFENVNILGTQMVIDFCTLSGAKLHHISTISVSGDYFEQGKENIQFTENDFYIGQNLGESVYLKSKFEGERIVMVSAKKGLNVSIYRVGNLTGRYSDGLFQSNVKDNMFYNLLRFFAAIKMISTDIYELEVELTPVDVCADTILGLAKRYDGEVKVFHLCNVNKVKIGEIVKAFNSLGSKIAVVGTECYRDRIEQIANDNNLKEMLIGVVNVLNRNGMVKTVHSIEVSCEITEIILKQMGIQWPDINHEYLRKMFQYMLEVGFVS